MACVGFTDVPDYINEDEKYIQDTVPDGLFMKSITNYIYKCVKDQSISVYTLTGKLFSYKKVYQMLDWKFKSDHPNLIEGITDASYKAFINTLADYFSKEHLLEMSLVRFLTGPYSVNPTKPGIKDLIKDGYNIKVIIGENDWTDKIQWKYFQEEIKDN